MKISELITELEKVKKEKGDQEILVSIDEEGNQYKPVWEVAVAEDQDEADKEVIVIFPMG